MLQEFWDFLNRGNAMDLAVGVIIGAAFTAIVDSLVADLITPLLLNPVMEAAGVDQLANLTWNGVAYGAFLAAILNFLIVGFVLFLLVRAINTARERLLRVEEEVEAEPPEDVALLQEIRDLLKEQNVS